MSTIRINEYRQRDRSCTREESVVNPALGGGKGKKRGIQSIEQTITSSTSRKAQSHGHEGDRTDRANA